jgi:hypothetical protein
VYLITAVYKLTQETLLVICGNCLPDVISFDIFFHPVLQFFFCVVSSYYCQFSVNTMYISASMLLVSVIRRINRQQLEIPTVGTDLRLFRSM